MDEADSAKFNSAQDGGRSGRLSVVRGRPHALCHLFATHLLGAPYNIRPIMEFRGHKDAKIYALHPGFHPHPG
jgi:site-specific recombinase XerC